MTTQLCSVLRRHRSPFWPPFAARVEREIHRRVPLRRPLRTWCTRTVFSFFSHAASAVHIHRRGLRSRTLGATSEYGPAPLVKLRFITCLFDISRRTPSLYLHARLYLHCLHTARLSLLMPPPVPSSQSTKSTKRPVAVGTHGPAADLGVDLYMLHLLSTAYTIAPQIYGTFWSRGVEEHEYFRSAPLTSTMVRGGVSGWEG